MGVDYDIYYRRMLKEQQLQGLPPWANQHNLNIVGMANFRQGQITETSLDWNSQVIPTPNSIPDPTILLLED